MLYIHLFLHCLYESHVWFKSKKKEEGGGERRLSVDDGGHCLCLCRHWVFSVEVVRFPPADCPFNTHDAHDAHNVVNDTINDTVNVVNDTVNDAINTDKRRLATGKDDDRRPRQSVHCPWLDL